MQAPVHVRLPDERYWREQINCQYACPVQTDARGYVRAIAAGDFEQAYLIARGPNPLASICGRVCGAPCEAACRRGEIDQGVSIRALKRFVTERWGAESRSFRPLDLLGRVLASAEQSDCAGGEELGSLKPLLNGLKQPPADAPRVAIIGSGPAGLAAAHDLALLGIRSVVFEMEPVPAGMLAVGIPEYRLPRDLIEAEIDVIRALGVEFRCNTRVGTDITLAEIRAQFDATIVAVGAKQSRKLPISGADGPGVFGGVEFLRDVALKNPTTLGQRIIVIGGGNVAYDVARSVVRQSEMDVSRTALRQAGVRQVNLVSLESLDELPADDIEILEGEEEGVRRYHRLGPDEVLRDETGHVRGMVFKRVKRVFDQRGQFSPEFDEGDKVTIEADTVLWAIGQRPDLSFIPPDADVRVNRQGWIECDQQMLTTGAPDVFVAGDIATGPRLLIHAVASGKCVARTVYAFLTGKSLRSEQRTRHLPIIGYRREWDYEKLPRTPIPTLDRDERVGSQSAVVERCYPRELACREAARCLDCGVNTIFDSDKCILCGGCADICPELCLRLVPVSALARTDELDRLLEARYSPDQRADASAIIKDESRCIRCALCAERCPVGAITMERMTFQQTWVEVSA